MIERFNRFIAYVCPDCSGTSDTVVNVFDFSGGKGVTLKCSDRLCKNSTGTLTMKNDKMKIALKCPVCTDIHTFTISKNAFWSQELVTFDCINSGITIFFAGERDAVIEAVNETERMLEEIEEEPDFFSDELKTVLRTLDILHDVLEKKRMICKCGSRNLFPVFESETMYVECEDCNLKIPIKPSPELLNLLSGSDDDFRL